MCELVKKCTKCEEEMALDLFGAEKKGKYGVRSQCKKCRLKLKQEWEAQNKDKSKVYWKKSRDKNKVKNLEKTNLRNKKWQSENKDKYTTVSRLSNVKYYKNNKDKINHRRKEYINNLLDPYIKIRLKLSNVPVTPELIDVKRNIIMIKRLTKKVNGK